MAFFGGNALLEETAACLLFRLARGRGEHGTVRGIISVQRQSIIVEETRFLFFIQQFNSEPLEITVHFRANLEAAIRPFSAF
jgi:hypothetical protein